MKRFLLSFFVFLALPLLGVVVSRDFETSSLSFGDEVTMNLTLTFDKHPSELTILPLDQRVWEAGVIQKQGPLIQIDDITFVWPVRVQLFDVGDVLVPTMTLDLAILDTVVKSGVGSSFLTVKSIRGTGENSDVLKELDIRFLNSDLIWYWKYVWVWCLCIVLLICLGVFVLRKRRKRVVKIIELSPLELAFKGLDDLESFSVLNHVHAVKFCFNLTEILKRYFGRVLNLSLLETTTTECVDLLKSRLDVKIFQDFRSLLVACDTVKFAKEDLRPSAQKELLDQARSLIQRFVG